MSDDNKSDVTDDEEFFDQSVNTAGDNEKTAAERRPSLSADDVNASSPEGGHGGDSDDESNSEHSSQVKRRASVEEEPCNTSTSDVKDTDVPSSTDGHKDEEHAHDSKTTETESTEYREPDQKQPPRSKKKNRKLTKTVVIEDENQDKKNSTKHSMSSYSKSGHSSDEGNRHLEAAGHSRRPVSGTSSSQELGTCKSSRAISAPIWRPQQSRLLSGFCNGSRVDAKMLLESLLHAESSHLRRKSVADPMEFRRRRNYTFSDERLEMIERENKRLLEKIVTIHFSEPTYSQASQKRETYVKPTTFPDIARTRQLEKIEKENLVWLQ